MDVKPRGIPRVPTVWRYKPYRGHWMGDIILDAQENPSSGDWFTYDDHVIRPMKVDQTKKKEAYLLFIPVFRSEKI